MRFAERARAALASEGLDPVRRIRLHNNLAVVELAADRLERASQEAESALALVEHCPPCPPPLDHAQLLHTLGVVRWLEGREQEAFAHLWAARKVWPFAMSPDYAGRLAAVVADLDVEWIDLPAAFAAEDPEFGGSRLISDWVHPNARGNALIARAIAEAL
jgi:hypothetical protein